MTDPIFETKAREAPGDVRGAMRDFLAAFEAFKQSNDQRLAAVEKKRQADILLVEKVERINKSLTEQKTALDRLALSQKRPPQGGPAIPANERKAAMQRYMRAGETAPLAALATLEGKALSVGSDADGGYLAPDETERIIQASVRDLSPIRQIAGVREIGANVFKKPVSAGGLGAGWVAETGARAQTATPQLTQIEFQTMELYAMPAASQALLDDAVVDVEQWLADEVQGEFAAQESAAFVVGDGVGKPRGFLAYATAPDATRAAAEIGYVASGAVGAFAAANPADRLLDLVYAPKAAYRANAHFVMSRSSVAAVRKLKDADGRYLWSPATEAGGFSSLMGYPLVEAEDMPDIAANAFSIAFGDFSRGYLIVDRQGVRVLRDPYTAKPYVLFYTTKRVGGGVQNFEAIKLMKFAAS